MNKSEVLYATLDDITTAIEIIHEHHISENSLQESLQISDILPIINIGCIKETDHVLVATSDIELFTWIISTFYMPKRLVVNHLHSINDKRELIADLKQRWNDFIQYFDGYRRAEPSFESSDVDNLKHLYNDMFMEESFDVVFFGYNIRNEFDEEHPNHGDRFHLETGEKFETFQCLLTEAARIVKVSCKVLLLSKPGWILKVWEQLHKLGLELEYHDYPCYVSSTRSPSASVWIRFVKRESYDFDIEKQKRNILSLMQDNHIDRLYAHRNDLRFPYVELSYKNSETFIQMDQRYKFMQYFFSLETTVQLAELCIGNTACLVTPSIAVYSHQRGKNVTLFENDTRFKQEVTKFVKYDLNIGLTKFTYGKYIHKFNVVICDPPFNVNLDILAKDIQELIKLEVSSIVYIVFPEVRKISLIRAMERNGLIISEEGKPIVLEYAKPPQVVRINGKKAIQLYKFIPVVL